MGVVLLSFINIYGKMIVPTQLSNGSVVYTAIGGMFPQVEFQGCVTVETAHERSFRPTRPLTVGLKQSRAVVKEKLGFSTSEKSCHP